MADTATDLAIMRRIVATHIWNAFTANPPSDDTDTLTRIVAVSEAASELQVALDASGIDLGDELDRLADDNFPTELGKPTPRSTTPEFNPAAAETVHYTDPRVRQLAEARWRLNTGGTRTNWLVLGKDNPEALISEARDWVRAAVAAGILPPPSR